MYLLILKLLTKEFLLLITTLTILIYVWFQYQYTYWTRRGVLGPNPVAPFGNVRDVIARKAQFFQPYCDNYFKYKHLPYIGMYCFHRPVLCVIDPDVIKHVLIKDFDHFQSHGIFSGGVGDPIAGHLFNLHGNTWKNLRVKMSPSFSTSKFKTMYSLVENIANDALAYADTYHDSGKSLNFSKFYETYTMEIIGSVGFGVECNGFKNPNSEFYVRGHEYFNPQTLYWTLVRALAFFAPDLFKKLKIRRIHPDIVNFFYNLVTQTVEYRQKNNFKRNDFLQTLIELKNDDSIDDKGENKIQRGIFSMTDVAANTMLYMFAGYETSATAGQLAAYELALNPHVQDKAREEVTRVLAKYNGQCTYDAQNEMTYMNMVIDESMRKYPPMRSLFRRCTKEYRLPNSDVIIEEGTLVFIPIQAIQMDPDIFPDPEKFDPERFSPEKKAKMHPCHWMPFGEGPRKCLGLRQGYVESKLALVKLLHKYELILDERTPVPMKIKASALACVPDGGVWLKLRKLEA
ncbi:probable cytochrome P450 6a14 [Papilio machaon]|uniref:probable cytochrome P450 6a14 n=1 Tax=Papilio machaon TaxID=76193 RepID=UPI001E664DFE|nr:probable cytochrome P450 6a14 [Papilio machaon]